MEKLIYFIIIAIVSYYMLFFIWFSLFLLRLKYISLRIRNKFIYIEEAIELYEDFQKEGNIERAVFHEIIYIFNRRYVKVCSSLDKANQLANKMINTIEDFSFLEESAFILYLNLFNMSFYIKFRSIAVNLDEIYFKVYDLADKRDLFVEALCQDPSQQDMS